MRAPTSVCVRSSCCSNLYWRTGPIWGQCIGGQRRNIRSGLVEPGGRGPTHPPTHPPIHPGSPRLRTIQAPIVDHRHRSAPGHQSSATLVRPSAPTRGLSRQSLRRESRPRPPREGAPRSLRTKIPETPRSVSSDLGTPNSLEAARIRREHSEKRTKTYKHTDEAIIS